MSAYLLPIADREPLAWILAEQRTAFSPASERKASRLEPGDALFLYATRGCFRNPTRDRGRVIGRAAVQAPARPLREPVCFGERVFALGIDLRIELLAPRLAGVELAPLVDRLHAFPDPASWSARMRRALIPLDGHDARLIQRELRHVAQPYPVELASYAA
jgi:hypothetical protein